MLKYVDVAVTFAEVLDEITLCINISNCPCHCEDCHSSYLAEDIGDILYVSTLNQLIFKNKGITCVAFMGGDSDPFEINVLAKAIRDNTDLKICWYSGRQELDKNIDLKNFDYIKLGPYIKEKGPINKITTNQRFYKVLHTKEISDDKVLYKLEDITYKFWK